MKQIKKQELIRKEYYLNNKVLKEISLLSNQRECAIFSTKNDGLIEKKGIARHITVKSISDAKEIFSYFELYADSALTFHNTVAQFRSIPRYSFRGANNNAKELLFIKKLPMNICGYDLVFDVDNCVSSKNGFSYANKLFAFFSHYELPFSIKFSGNGFHFQINYCNLSKLGFTPGDIYATPSGKNLAPRVSNFLKFSQKIKNLDLVFNDYYRLIKAPYSIVGTKLNQFVALPLTDEQFENFEISMAFPQNVLDLGSLGSRGIQERSGNLRGLKDFLSDVFCQKTR